ncbi:MAG TPA: AAA family ATPase [Candidatus Limnocylindrales bacterium]|jgi:Predicted ATP-dependent serine protease|nr:AAA family ATPase [Candidatus Limnocylindrales bacterium]
MPTGIDEMDRVLGGGLVPGSVVLLGGEPGIGKSTLLLQASAGLATGARPATSAGTASSERGATGSRGPSGGHVLYATGEESAGQVRLRAGRLGLLDGPVGERIQVVAEGEVGRIVELARDLVPTVLIVDSIQTVTADELEGPAGSVGQVRECTLRLMEVAKQEGVVVILVGHVTKDGSLAGPKALEHLVDAVLSLEGERTATMRLLRATKNRFGSTEEVGVFEMAEHGLAEVADPGRAFLSVTDEHAPGSVAGAALEGTRPLLVEVQALVAPGGYGSPRRTASGIDVNRLALLVAVLGRRAGIGLGSHDVYANLAGGLDLTDPGLDLPLAIALASSLRDKNVPRDLIAIGEVGLLGELRPVPGLERRLREAARLGFATAIVPRTGRSQPPAVKGLEVVAVSNLREAVGRAIGGDPARVRDVEGVSARMGSRGPIEGS